MSVEEHLSDAVRSSPRYAGLAHDATSLLRDAIGDSRIDVRASWDLASNKHGQPVLRLHLSDYEGEVEAVFQPEELTQPTQARRDLYWLWGGLMQNRAHRLVGEVLAGLGEDK